jgi:predicted enzyme related to lactoylglutathione lyase
MVSPEPPWRRLSISPLVDGLQANDLRSSSKLESVDLVLAREYVRWAAWFRAILPGVEPTSRPRQGSATSYDSVIILSAREVTMADATIRGRFVWHELMTADTTAAAAFYPKVVGWKVEAWERDPSYTIWIGPSGPVGGLMTLPDDAKAMGVPPSWLAYIGTPDVAVTAGDAQRLGGRVLKDVTEIPTVGRFAVLADPQGAVFAAFTPAAGPMSGGGPPKLGEFSWHELATTDQEAAFQFYQQLFGWEKTGSHDMGPMGTYQLFGFEGTSLGGMFNKPKEAPARPWWLSYSKVDDAGDAAQRVKAAGGQIVNGPMEVPGGDWITQCLDLQGAAFAVHSMKKAQPAEKPAARKPAPQKAKAKKTKAKRAKPVTKTAAKKAGAKRAKAARKRPSVKGGKKPR